MVTKQGDMGAQNANVGSCKVTLLSHMQKYCKDLMPEELVNLQSKMCMLEE